MAGECIATFYSHFGAMSFKKKCDAAGIAARIMPVPRSLSSSCGTCVKFNGAPLSPDWISEELEQIVKLLADGGYQCLYSAEEG